MTLKASLPILAAATLLGGCFSSAPAVEVKNPWIRAVGGNGALYMTIENDGGSDSLTGVSTDAAAMAAIHDASNEGGIARMRPHHGALAVERHKGAVLAPGGTHFMLMKLTRPLKPGDTVKVTLAFARSGQKAIDVPVRMEAPTR